ncbi:MAG: heavy metal-associated domain-containing protein [Acidobacteriota bacterium]
MLTNFAVKGMHCLSCKSLIEEELSELPGVHKIGVDFAAGRAWVDYDEQTVKPEMIVEKISQLGYRAEVAA